MTVRTWRAAARILGISEDTLARHRRFHGDRTVRPWWLTDDEVVAWYRALIAPPPEPPAPAPKPRRKRDEGTYEERSRALLRSLREGR